MKKSWLFLNSDVNQDHGNGTSADTDNSGKSNNESGGSLGESNNKAGDNEPTLAEVVQKAYKESNDKKEASSSELKSQEAEKSSVQKLNDTKKESQDESKDSKDGKKKDSDVSNKDNKTDKQNSDKEDKKVEDKADEQGEDDKVSQDDKDSQDDNWEEKVIEARKPVPYDRFKTIYDTKKSLEASLQDVQPLADSHKQIVDYCQKNQISSEQFSQGLELLAVMNSDPTVAMEKLSVIMTELRSASGDILPTDLQAEVDSGDLTEARAKEIAKYRAQSTLGEKSKARSEQQLAQEREQTFLREVATSSASWTRAKQTSDPDFQPKKDSNAVDGKYELVRVKYLAMVNETNHKGEFVNPVSSAQDVMKYLEKAYKEVDRMFAAMHPRSKDKTKILSSQDSQHSQNEAPTSLTDVVRQRAAVHGITV